MSSRELKKSKKKKTIPNIKADELLHLAAEKAQESLYSYTKLTYPQYAPNWHHKLIIEFLQKVECGDIDRLMILIPPRYGKSELSSIRFPAWFIGRNPSKKMILASYGDQFSSNFSKHARNLCQSGIHREIFPDCKVMRDSSSASVWETDKGGKMVAVGRGGAVTGHGAHLLILDDLIKNIQEAYSETIRDTIWDWYKTTLYTRLEEDAKIVLVNTRWHSDDLVGRLLEEEGDKWTVLTIPAIADQDYDYDGYIFKEGETLWPDKYPLPIVEETKESLGKFFEPIYQQDPQAETGNILKRDDWQPIYQIPADAKWIIQSWDTGFKTGEENSYSACTTWIETETSYVLIDAWWDKVPFPELKRVAENLYHKHTPNEVLIEDKASGQSLIQELQQGTKIPVKAIKPTGDKIARAHIVSPVFGAKQVYILEGQEWTEDVISHCAKFPGTKNTDIVDSVTQAIEHLRHGHNFKYTPHYANNKFNKKRKSIIDIDKENRRHAGR